MTKEFIFIETKMDQDKIIKFYEYSCAQDIIGWSLLYYREENLGTQGLLYYNRYKNVIIPWINGIRNVSISNKEKDQESDTLMNKGIKTIEKISVIAELGLVIYTHDAFFVCWYQDDPGHFNLWKNKLIFWSENQNTKLTLRFVSSGKALCYEGDHIRSVYLLIHE